MNTISKKDKKRLRELADEAYEKDIARSLDMLNEQFAHWKAGKISAWDLNQHIHEFHDKTARKLYKMYAMAEPGIAVGFAVQRGVISLEEVPESVKASIAVNVAPTDQE